jgi:hypothetical protein
MAYCKKAHCLSDYQRNALFAGIGYFFTTCIFSGFHLMAVSFTKLSMQSNAGAAAR